MSGRASGRALSLVVGLALAAATVLVYLLVGEAISRLSDPNASLWRWPFRLAEASDAAPGTTQFAYDATLGWAPIAGSSGTMRGKTLSFTAEGMRAHNTDAARPTGPLILAFGDSMTEGFAVGDRWRWALIDRLSGSRVQRDEVWRIDEVRDDGELVINEGRVRLTPQGVLRESIGNGVAWSDWSEPLDLTPRGLPVGGQRPLSAQRRTRGTARRSSLHR